MANLLTSLTRVNAGGAQLDFIPSIPLGLANGAAVFVAANAAVLTRVRVAKPTPITTMSYLVSVVSGNVDLGIYTSTDQATFTRLGSTGSTAAAGSANTIQSIALTASVTLQPNVDYWLAFAADNITISIARALPIANVAGFKAQNVSKATSFPLPTSITSTSAQNYTPWTAAS